MESFVLNIEATSEDGVNIKQQIEAKVKCSGNMAVGVIVEILKSNEDLRSIILEGVNDYLQEESINQHKNNQNYEA